MEDVTQKATRRPRNIILTQTTLSFTAHRSEKYSITVTTAPYEDTSTPKRCARTVNAECGIWEALELITAVSLLQVSGDKEGS